MFKVLIVDDEAIRRKGLRNIINWESFECEICGEASDGIECMGMIEKLKPDVIITDINMPEIDGLKIIIRAKELVSQCKIIILTGYRNFEFIQEAIKLGASDYVLKPSKTEEIIKIIKKAIKDLKEIEKKEEKINNLKKHFEGKLPALKEKLLYDIIFDINFKRKDIQKELKIYGMNIENFNVLTVEAEYGGECKSRYDKQLYQFGIINTFINVFSDDFIINHSPIDYNKIIFIIEPLIVEMETMSQINKKAKELQCLIKNSFDFTITVAISNMGNSALELSERAREANNALQYKFYMGTNSIILFKDVKNFYSIEDYSEYDSLGKLLIKYIHTGNIENTRNTLNEIFEYVKENDIEMNVIKADYINTLAFINNLKLLSNNEDNYKKNLYSLLDENKNIKELNSLIEEIVISTVIKVNKFNKKTINSNIQKAVKYINEHYMEQITLKDISESINVGSYYLSRMFTIELGKNFVSYINEVRIEKAKEYLQSSYYKTYEIAEMVGVRDAHYFSKLFKKLVGMTPSEYKDKK